MRAGKASNECKRPQVATAPACAAGHSAIVNNRRMSGHAGLATRRGRSPKARRPHPVSPPGRRLRLPRGRATRAAVPPAAPVSSPDVRRAARRLLHVAYAISFACSRRTPAFAIAFQAASSEPLRSMPRQASSITAASRPALRASSALQETQKSVARPQK